MKFTIKCDTLSVVYQSSDFWKQFDEVEVENPEGWYIRYIEGGIVHTFDYSQSSGRGEYCDRYVETERKIPLAFTDDARHNAKIMHDKNYDGKNAVLIQEL